MKEAFCCESFKERINSAGQKGFSIIPVENPYIKDDYAYFLQTRNVDETDNESRHIIIETGILYCPWCGSKLTEVTKKNKDAIAEIAEKNKHLIKL
jgi:hypothetical protein